MTTQQTSRALAREAAGLCLTAFGALGVLIALGMIHPVLGLSAAMVGFLVAGSLTKPEPDAPRWAHKLRYTVCGVGIVGLAGCAFALYLPLGFLCVALAAVLVGLWLSSREPAAEGA
ncbi:hypothetical protein ACFWCA_19480 [Streptomyces phaeochromogenes]|uniref:hypothetical protein n=1 Tax=Streptomyces phaeochromogenes TaxID=1923 RepID=UPI00369705D5